MTEDNYEEEFVDTEDEIFKDEEDEDSEDDEESLSPEEEGFMAGYEQQKESKVKDLEGDEAYDKAFDSGRKPKKK